MAKRIRIKQNSQIIRVRNHLAESLVNSGAASYVGKETWKKERNNGKTK